MNQTKYGLTLFAGLLVACGGEEQGLGELIVRDSAGVPIVEYPHGLISAPVWSLEVEPTVVLGGLDGPEETLFSQIVAAFSGRDGTLVVADALSREIRWFDGTGGHLRTIGGRGDGPSEFQVLSWVGRLRGDTIGAWDSSVRRLSLFSLAGDYLASHQVEPILSNFDSPPGTFIAPTPRVLGVLGDGSILAELIMVYPDVPAGVRRDSVPLMRFDPVIDDWERIGTTLTGELFIDSHSEVIQGLPLPFGLRTSVAVAHDWAVFGWGDGTGLTVVDSKGRREAVIRPNLDRLAVTPNEIHSDRTARIQAVPEGIRDEYRIALEAVPYPSVHPAHGAIVAGDGEFWLEALDSAVERSAHPWFIFSRSGYFRALVEVPVGLRITDVRSDHLVGVHTDEFDVQRVVRFELRRGAL